ncbi:hypothetical protein HYT02_04435 [Candidatus Gottesmanbacteria bacterium]|nr:hypothetical protein [Candidatus Gottesmanbacteria bacterium]
MSNESQSSIRYEREFGKATLIGSDRSFLSKPKDQQLVELAWSDGCVDPKAVERVYGTDWTIQRYAEVNFWTGWIWERADTLNPKLGFNLQKIYPRRKNEPPEQYKPNSIPQSHKKQFFPMTTPWGYAGARVLIEQFGRGQEKTSQRIEKGLAILDYTLMFSSPEPAEFLALLAEGVIKEDASKTAVLGHVLAREIEKEGGGYLLKRVVDNLQEFAPTIWDHYLQLSHDDRIRLGIISKL